MPGWLRRRIEDIRNIGTIPSSVIVFREGDYAVAVDGKTKEVIARSTDHAKVIQTAIDNLPNGGKIVLNGVFTLTKGLELGKLITIEGMGLPRVGNEEVATLKVSSGFTGSIIKLKKSVADNETSISLRNLLFVGYTDDPTANLVALDLAGVTFGSFENLRFFKLPNCIYIHGGQFFDGTTTTGKARENRFYNIEAFQIGNGIYIYGKGATNHTFTVTRISEYKGYGLKLDGDSAYVAINNGLNRFIDLSIKAPTVDPETQKAIDITANSQFNQFIGLNVEGGIITLSLGNILIGQISPNKVENIEKNWIGLFNANGTYGGIWFKKPSYNTPDTPVDIYPGASSVYFAYPAIWARIPAGTSFDAGTSILDQLRCQAIQDVFEGTKHVAKVHVYYNHIDDAKSLIISSLATLDTTTRAIKIRVDNITGASYTTVADILLYVEID